MPDSSQLDSVLASAADFLHRQGVGDGAAAVDAARKRLLDLNEACPVSSRKTRSVAMHRYLVQLHGWIQPDCGYHERPLVYADNETNAIRKALDGIMAGAHITSAEVVG